MKKSFNASTVPPLNCKHKSWQSNLFISRLTLLLMLVATLLAAIQVEAAQPDAPPPLVTVAAVTEQDVNPPREYVGHIEAVQEVDLQARVAGLLERVNFKEGSEVLAGDLLYVIEQAPFQARVDAARARLNKAQATLNRAGSYLKRLRDVRDGGVSATDLEAAEADELESRAEFEEAGAALALAQLDLDYTRIAAPISGRIGASLLTRGNLCGPTTGPLAKIVQLDPIRVIYSISENDLNLIRVMRNSSSKKDGKALLQPRLRLADGNILDLSGQVDFVDNVVDARTGTVAVRLLFDNPDGRLLPGQYVAVLISRNEGVMKPVVQQSSVLEDQDGRYLLVVNAQNTVEQRRISTGAMIGPLWAIESGLSVGELVITEGLQKVGPGQTVQTVIADSVKGN